MNDWDFETISEVPEFVLRAVDVDFSLLKGP